MIDSGHQEDSEDDEDWSDEPVTLTLTSVRRTAERKRQEMRRREMERNSSAASLPSVETTRTALMLRPSGEPSEQPITCQPHAKSTYGVEETSVRDAKPASASSVVSCQPLPPLTDPLTTLSDCLESLQHSSNWDVTYESVTNYRRLLRHHSDLLLLQLSTAVTGLVSQARNLRTQVSRVAIVTLGEMFHYLSTKMDCHVDVTSRVLLERCGEARGFLRDDAHVALTLMTSNTSTNRCLLALLSFGANNKNVNVKNTTSSLVADIVENADSEKLLNASRDLTERLLTDSATFLLDGQAITRHNAQRIFYAIMWQNNFDQLLSRHLSPNVLRNVRKKLDKLRANGVGVPPSELSSARSQFAGSRSGTDMLSSSLTSSRTCDVISLPKINAHHLNDVTVHKNHFVVMSSSSAARHKEHHWRTAKSLPSLRPYDSDDLLQPPPPPPPPASSAPSTRIFAVRRCEGDLSSRLLVARDANVEQESQGHVRNNRNMEFVLGDDPVKLGVKCINDDWNKTVGDSCDADSDEGDDYADNGDDGGVEAEFNNNENCSQNNKQHSSFNTDNDFINNSESKEAGCHNDDSAASHDHNSDRESKEQYAADQRQGHGHVISVTLSDKRRWVVEEMRVIKEKLSSSDRQQKIAGIQRLDSLLTSECHLPEHAILQVIDKFIPCVRDGSSKVTVSALRVLTHIAQPLGTFLTSQSIHVTLLLQALISNLSSNSRLIRDETFTALDKVIDHIDGGVVVIQQLAASVPHANKISTKCEMVKRLAYLVSLLHASKSRVVTQHTLPVLWHLVTVVRVQVREEGDDKEEEETDDQKLTSAARQLACSLQEALGGDELMRLARLTRTLSLHQLLTLQHLLV